jgi:alkylhydroperoxidase family enzyme
VPALAGVEDESGAAGIVASHSLIPDALRHAFSTFAALMAPDLPLTRRQQEMITTTVSALNRCYY